MSSVKYLFLMLALACSMAQDSFAIAIHGGAGTLKKSNMTPEKDQAYRSHLQKALDLGYEVLNRGGSSLDAVEVTIRYLEDCPLFNAGKGAVFTAEGRNELDASIMDGNGQAGAVASVTTVKNPISLARQVMDKTPHVLLVGDGAEKFADEMKVERVENEYFKTERQWNRYLARKNEKKMGTVGAVALDKNGNLAAATSTGGLSWKKFGRVGDSPIIGAGTYAKNGVCAVSCTGQGEYFIRLVLAYRVAAHMELGQASFADAANHAIHHALNEAGGTGGMIVLSSEGHVAMPFNTAGMYRGYRNSSGESWVSIYKDEKSGTD